MSTEVAKMTNSGKEHSGSDHEHELNQATDLDRVQIKVPRFQTFLKRSAFHLKVELLASSSFSMGSFLRGRTNGLGEMISTWLQPTHLLFEALSCSEISARKIQITIGCTIGALHLGDTRPLVSLFSHKITLLRQSIFTNY